MWSAYAYACHKQTGRGIVMRKGPAYGESGTSNIILNQGKALKWISATYSTVEKTTLEAVGNAIDENPKTIWIDVNLKARTVEIADDGDGASLEEFEREALESVAESTKGDDKIGRFGFGFMAGLSICERYTFIAVPKRGGQGYIEWVFDTKILVSKKVELDVPYKERLDLRYSKHLAGKTDGIITYVPWRAAIKFFKISTDKIIGRISPDSLEGEILARYGVSLRKRNIVIFLHFVNADGQEVSREIRGKDFQGEPLEHFIINPPNTNEFAEFKLYLAPLTIKGRRGVIHFGERGSEYRICDKEFVMSVVGLMDEDVGTALRSGIFEGEILSSCAKGNEDRHSFNRNEDLSNFCVANVQGYRERLEQHVMRIREANKEKRYQELSLRALDRLQHLLSNPQYQRLLERSLPFVGTTGTNHAPPKRPLGETDQKGVAVQMRKQGQGNSNPGNGINGSRRKLASEEDPAHHPLVATGPSGKKRIEVKNSSIGLTFVHVEMFDSNAPYIFIPEKGVLEFNIRHHWFVQCDVTDAKLVRYQCEAALSALTLNAQPIEWREIAQVALLDRLELDVFQITH